MQFDQKTRAWLSGAWQSHAIIFEILDGICESFLGKDSRKNL
jgi:hypothetical protein